MNFPDRLRMPFSFDPVLLARDLRALSHVEWIDHFVKQNYAGNWSVIPLRGPAGATHPVMMIYSDPAARAFEDTPMLAAAPYMRSVLRAFDCAIGSARLMRLTPGSIVKEHRDNDLDFADGCVRFHIPVTTNPDVEFLLNGVRVEMEPGSAWYLRLADPHSVSNRGATDRVHLVFDALADDRVKALLESALNL